MFVEDSVSLPFGDDSVVAARAEDVLVASASIYRQIRGG